MNQARPARVSVIIPVFNRPEMLAEAVLSVQEQVLQQLEIIIIDDGSTDNTREVADSLAEQDPRIVVHSIQNAGPGAARNAGIALANAAFIQFLDSDDLLCPHKLSDAMEAFQADPQLDIVYSPTDLYYTDTGVTEKAFGKTGVAGAQILPDFLVMRWWKTPSAVYRTQLIRDAGPILDLITLEDWEFECRLGAGGLKPGFSARTGSVCRMHSGERLSRPDIRNIRLWSSRAVAFLQVWEHLQSVKLSFDSPEMLHFMKSLFLLSRQCGAAGLITDSEALHSAASEIARRGNHRATQINLYAAAASLIGWKLSGQLAHGVDVVRDTLKQSLSSGQRGAANSI